MPGDCAAGLKGDMRGVPEEGVGGPQKEGGGGVLLGVLDGELRVIAEK